MYATNQRIFGLGFTASGQSNENKGRVEVPSNLLFRRVYASWFHWDCGDVVIVGKLSFKLGNNSVHEESFKWYSGIVPATATDENGRFWLPPFTVNRRASGVGNAYPYELPANPDARVMSYGYTDGGGSGYHVQITAQPLKLPIRCDSIELAIEGTAGTLPYTVGYLFGMLKVDSAQLPL